MEQENFPKLDLFLVYELCMYVRFKLYFEVFFLQPVWYQILPSVSVILIRKGGSIYETFLVKQLLHIWM